MFKFHYSNCATYNVTMLKHVLQKVLPNYLACNRYRSLSSSKACLADSEDPTGKKDDPCQDTRPPCKEAKQEKKKESPKVKICDKKTDVRVADCEGVATREICEESAHRKEENMKEAKKKGEQKPTVEKKVEKKKEDKPKAQEMELSELTIGSLSGSNFDDSKVVIVGAGLAGLAAAKYLQENNIRNYVILEAQGRPGGRIHSQWFSDAIVELGTKCPRSNTDSSTFVQAAIADGFIKPPFSCMSIFKTCDGLDICPTLSTIAYETYKTIYCESLALEGNSLEYMCFRIEQEVKNFPPKVRSEVARVMLAILAMQFKKEGDNLKQFVSSSGFVSYLHCPSGKLKVPLGYYGIMQPMLNAIPSENIIYNRPVQNIRWGAVVCKDTPRALVKCSNGSVYPADYVIITVSLGVLKEQQKTLFCPALPCETVDTINSMGFLHRNNIYFQFDRPFWSWCPNTIDICYTEEDTADFLGWTKALKRIRQVPGSNDVLHVSVLGNEAADVEKLSDLALIEGVKEQILGEMNTDDFPKVKSSLKSSWSSNIYFYGAYSYLPFGLHDGIQQTLANSLPGNNAPVNPILFFAGEATCPKLSGTVQAAKISGIREATRVKKLIAFGADQATQQKMAASL